MLEVKSRLIFGKNVNNAKISILIPTVRVNDLAYEAILSALNQEKANIDYEVIVLINNPDFNNYEIFPRDNRLIVYQNDKMISMKDNIRKIATLSNAHYIAYLHDDDVLLPNYIYYINKLLTKREYDCLIPGRYTIYPHKIQSKNIIKETMINILLFFRFFYRKRIGIIKNKDCILSLENCFTAPTCGTLFNRELFLNTNGFDSEFDYAFDFDYFLRFNEKYKVYYYRKKLGKYITTESASNKLEVQLDFWNCWMSVLHKYGSVFSKKNMELAIYYLFCFWNENTQKEILLNGYNIKKFSKLKYFMIFIRRLVYKYIHNLDITKTIRR